MFYFNRLGIFSSRSTVWSAAKNPVIKGKNMEKGSILIIYSIEKEL